MKRLLLTLCIAIGLFRPVLIFKEFNPHIEASYQAFAHILVGVLLVLMFYQHKHTKAMFWTLTAIEVVCAGVTVAMKRGLL